MNHPREISLEFIASVLEYNPDTGVFRWTISRGRNAKAGSVAGSIDSHGHRQIMLCGKSFFAHRLAWFLLHGEWPSQQIDHINGNRDDNRSSNLRLATRRENRWNAISPVGRSGLPGAQYRKTNGRWQSAITVNGEKKYLGEFDTAEQAHAAYVAASKKLHGNFSRFAR